jgi:hypothetical protein
MVKRYAIPDVDGEHITAGKKYEIIQDSEYGPETETSFSIRLDNGFLAYCLKEAKMCAHLDGRGSWDILEENEDGQ